MTPCPVECYQDAAELAWLVDHVRALRPARVLEIGSLFGGTLWEWLKLMPRGGTLVSVDMLVPIDDPRYMQQFGAHSGLWPAWASAAGVQLEIVEASSTKPKTIATVQRLIPAVDFLFIDGAHDLRSVQSDLHHYGPLVIPGGMIALHDIDHDKCEVRAAWRQLKERYPHATAEKITTPGARGIGVLRVT